MSTKILVTYATNAGSTSSVAETIAKELRQGDVTVDVRRVAEVSDLGGYAAIIVGAPMIMGWHKAAQGFLKAQQPALSKVPVAYFVTCISLTQPDSAVVLGVPVTLDPTLAKPPKHPGHPSLRERYSSGANYLGPILKAAPQVRPVNVGFFAGNVAYYRLNLFQKLFAMLLTGGRAGDFRNWDAIQAWAKDVRPLLLQQ